MICCLNPLDSESLVLWPKRTHLNPALERIDFLRRQLDVRRHLQIAQATDGKNQSAVENTARNDGGPPVTACEHSLERVDSQSALLGMRPVAFEATRNQNGPHVALKVIGLQILVSCNGFRLQTDSNQANKDLKNLTRTYHATSLVWPSGKSK